MSGRKLTDWRQSTCICAHLLIVIVLGVVAVFAVLNWHVVVLPASLSLGFATVEAPLGLILLAVTAALTLLFLIYLVYLQSAALIESRRYARELQYNATWPITSRRPG